MWLKRAHLLKPRSDAFGKIPFNGPQKWIKPSSAWKQYWGQMSSLHTPTTTYHSTFTLMLLTIIWALLPFNNNYLLCIGLKKWLTPNRITILWWKNCYTLSWSLQHSIPCFLVLNSSFVLITKISPFANLNFCCVLCWKYYVEEYGLTILYHPSKRMALSIHFHGSHILVCLQFQRGRMFLLSSLTLLLTALTPVMTLTCSSVFSTCHYLMLQTPTLLTFDGYMTSKILALNLLQR